MLAYLPLATLQGCAPLEMALPSIPPTEIPNSHPFPRLSWGNCPYNHDCTYRVECQRDSQHAQGHQQGQNIKNKAEFCEKEGGWDGIECQKWWSLGLEGTQDSEGRWHCAGFGWLAGCWAGHSFTWPYSIGQRCCEGTLTANSLASAFNWPVRNTRMRCSRSRRMSWLCTRDKWPMFTKYWIGYWQGWIGSTLGSSSVSLWTLMVKLPADCNSSEICLLALG